MEKINALAIQEMLKKEDSVSVPWIQLKLSLDYKDAKELLRYLINRGWVETETQGVDYAVLKQNLRLRKLQRKEVEPLIADITMDCVKAMRCAEKGATFSELEDAIDGEDDTHVAIEILTRHNLIYKAGDCYHTTVSRQTIRVLDNVVCAKRQTELKRRITGKEDCERVLRELFAVLFEEE